VPISIFSAPAWPGFGLGFIAQPAAALDRGDLRLAHVVGDLAGTRASALR
jgi:hypothetical protein